MGPVLRAVGSCQLWSVGVELRAEAVRRLCLTCTHSSRGKELWRTLASVTLPQARRLPLLV